MKVVGHAPIFPGDSEIARRLRAVDWSLTEFGPTERWSSTLRTVVGICLTATEPMLVWWGPKFAFLYNDASIPPFRRAASDSARAKRRQSMGE